MEIIKFIKKPKNIILCLMDKGYFNFLSDKIFIRLKYEILMNSKLNLENPKTFNEKLQWLKLYDRKDIYTIMADKYAAKKYISNLIGEKYIIPTLGIYSNFDEIDFMKLPNKFVIKCTHDSGGLVICKDKSKLNIKSAKNKINKCLSQNYYYTNREWVYKNIEPKIIIEKYIDGLEFDYRFYCFEGTPKYIYVYTEKEIGSDKPSIENCDIYNIKWEKQEFHNKSLPSKNGVLKPKLLDEMIKISKKISKNTHFLRVDFYYINGKIYLSELTFYPGAGFSKFYPEKYDYNLGSLIKINN